MKSFLTPIFAFEDAIDDERNIRASLCDEYASRSRELLLRSAVELGVYRRNNSPEENAANAADAIIEMAKFVERHCSQWDTASIFEKCGVKMSKEGITVYRDDYDGGHGQLFISFYGHRENVRSMLFDDLMYSNCKAVQLAHEVKDRLRHFTKFVDELPTISMIVKDAARREAERIREESKPALDILNEIKQEKVR